MECLGFDINKMQDEQIKYLMERIVISGSLTTSEKQIRNQNKEECVNHMIEQWFSNPEIFLQMFIWDADTKDWHQNTTQEQLFEMINDHESVIWSNDTDENGKKNEFVNGLITVRQAFKSLNDDETIAWNMFKEQMAEKLNMSLPPEAMSQSGFPSKLQFISDLLRKLYHCYAGEIDFGGNIGTCGIRMPLHHTLQWEQHFTQLLYQRASLVEVLSSFTLEQLTCYGW